MHHYRVSAFDPAKGKSVIFNLSGSTVEEVRAEVKLRGLRLNSLNVLESADSFAPFAETQREEKAESPYKLRLVGGGIGVLAILLVIAGIRGISSTHASQSEPAAQTPTPPASYTVTETASAAAPLQTEPVINAAVSIAHAQPPHNGHTTSPAWTDQTPGVQDPR